MASLASAASTTSSSAKVGTSLSWTTGTGEVVYPLRAVRFPNCRLVFVVGPLTTPLSCHRKSVLCAFHGILPGVERVLRVCSQACSNVRFIRWWLP